MFLIFALLFGSMGASRVPAGCIKQRAAASRQKSTSRWSHALGRAKSLAFADIRVEAKGCEARAKQPPYFVDSA